MEEELVGLRRDDPPHLITAWGGRRVATRTGRRGEEVGGRRRRAVRRVGAEGRWSMVTGGQRSSKNGGRRNRGSSCRSRVKTGGRRRSRVRSVVGGWSKRSRVKIGGRRRVEVVGGWKS